MTRFGGQKKEGPLLVGLTGQTGAGKSTVTAAFAEKGFVVIDCDQLTRELQSRPEVLARLQAAFGSQVIREDGSLDRKMLAVVAFSEPKQTEKLGTVMFPPIKAEIEARVKAAEAAGHNHILLDAPTLFESGLDKVCARKVSVIAAEAVRRERIIRRDHLTEEEADRRMAAQHPDAWYTVRSDFVLKNNGTKEELLEAGKNLAAQMVKAPNQDGKTAVTALISILLVIVVITGVYTLAYRAIYPRDFAGTAASYAETLQTDEYFLMALAHAAGTEEEAEFAGTLDALSALLPGADEDTLAAAYYAGAEAVEGWLADPSVSPDGVSLSHIPDGDAAAFAEQVRQDAKIYRNLYG